MNIAKVLTIDDELEFCKAVKIGLEATRKFEVIIASKAREGLQMARKENPDIILLDIMMPELTGTEIAEELLDSENTKDIPIIFVTALMKGDEEYGNAGRYHLMAKPVNISDLIEQIENVLLEK
jgi:DNA-binding response OmpR family regulator